MISGSVRLQGVKLSFPSSVVATTPVAEPETGATPAPAPVEAPTPVETTEAAPAPAETASTGSLFTWAVPGADLGTHAVGDKLATTLSCTYQGNKVSDYSISAGQLPPDIALTSTSGILLGTLQLAGNYSFTIRAKADALSSDCSYKIEVTE